MALFGSELLAVAILAVVTCYGALISGASMAVVIDFTTVVSLLGLAITIANAAAREFAGMTMHWGFHHASRALVRAAGVPLHI